MYALEAVHADAEPVLYTPSNMPAVRYAGRTVGKVSVGVVALDESADEVLPFVVVYEVGLYQL